MDLDVVTVNSEDPYKDFLKFVEEAVELFPSNIWDAINYKGEVEFPYDEKLLVDGEPIHSFNWIKLISRLRKIKEKKPLMGVVSNLVYQEKTEIRDGKLIRTYTAVYEFMEEIGFVSLFKLGEQVVSKVMAHALGHNRGLGHHRKPIDLMYLKLVKHSLEEPFCERCTYVLERSEGTLNMVRNRFEHYLKTLNPFYNNFNKVILWQKKSSRSTYEKQP